MFLVLVYSLIYCLFVELAELTIILSLLICKNFHSCSSKNLFFIYIYIYSYMNLYKHVHILKKIILYL